MAFEMACDHELADRVQGADSRRRIFARQLELMRRLDPAWEARERVEIERILEEYPYADDDPAKP